MATLAYVEKLDRQLQEANEAIRLFIKEHEEVIEAFNMLLRDRNQFVISLNAVLGDVREACTVAGKYRRSSYDKKEVADIAAFLREFGQVVLENPQLVKAIDVKSVEQAVNFGKLPRDAMGLVVNRPVWRTDGKPKELGVWED